MFCLADVYCSGGRKPGPQTGRRSQAMVHWGPSVLFKKESPTLTDFKRLAITVVVEELEKHNWLVGEAGSP